MSEVIRQLGINTEIDAIFFVGLSIYLVFLSHLYWVLVDFVESFINAIRSIKRSKKNANKQETNK